MSRFNPLSRLILSLLLVPVLSWSAPVTLNLKDADINALIASIAEITGRNFIVDPRVSGRVSVISSKPMDEDEIYRVFLSVLAVHGFAAVPGQNVTKIIPSANAKQENIPTLDAINGGGEDQVITRIIEVENVSAAQIVPILRPLVPPQGHLAAYAATNVLIISDLAGNVERLANIIERMDQASNQQTEIVALQHASAIEVVRLVEALEQQNAPTAQAAGPDVNPPRLVADERTNSILLSGDQSDRLRLRGLIAHLDTPLQRTGNTQVVYLRYAQAADMLPILQGLSQQLSAGAGAAEGTPTNTSDVSIQADESTNALVITAPLDTMRSLREVISQLDIRRAQVKVEAVIAEISSEKVAELGVQWVALGESLAGFINFDGGLNLEALAGAVLNEQVSSGLVAGGANIAAGSLTGSNRFGAILGALASDADTNILSTPTLVTLDNEEAEIVVGQNVPFVTGNFTTSTGGGGEAVGNPFQTIERQDVGLTLRIKPQINEGNAVQLQIEQEVSNVVPTATALAQGPTTNKRSIRTNVLVEDGQILVLGGLIDNDLSETAQKVPGLGDAPLVGGLFRYQTSSRSKRNLMIFLHPVILRDSETGTLRTNEKYSYIRQQQLAARRQQAGLLPPADTPLLTPPEQVRAQGSFTTPPADSPPTTPPLVTPAFTAEPTREASEPRSFGFNSK